jgi:sirohydrochlorin cobaltochelatase
MPSTWILLLAHGSRRPEWAEPFHAVLQRVRAARPDCRVELAFLESMTPLLPDALRAAAQAGCRELYLAPLLLGAGGHLRGDIPRAVDAVAREHTALRVHVAEAAGAHPAVVDALAAYATTAAPRD